MLKLSPLLRLRYKNALADAVRDLGSPKQRRGVFIGFQRYLYQVQRAEPSRGLRKLVAQGRLGTKSLAGYWTWTPEQVQAERARFEAVLGAAAELLARSPAQLPTDPGTRGRSAAM